MDLVSSKYIEEFIPGEKLYHGAIQVTPFRNKEYIKKFSKNYALGIDSKLAGSLGYIDPNIQIKKQNFGIESPSMLSQGYLFNVGFGLSVHDISFNAIANLSYKNLRYGVPAYEGDILFATSEVLGIEVKKDGYADVFIQYIENINRKELNNKADLIATNFQDIINFIKNV